jgi:hypothetical protein
MYSGGRYQDSVDNVYLYTETLETESVGTYLQTYTASYSARPQSSHAISFI